MGRRKINEVDIIREYHDWLKTIGDLRVGHNELAFYLDDIPFEWDLDKDENRMWDGLAMRRTFYDIFEWIDDEWKWSDVKALLERSYFYSNNIDRGTCSVFEMICGLGWRMERDIMRVEEMGDRTAVWISSMLKNLGLLNFDDDIWREGSIDCWDRTRKIVYRMMRRQYKDNGRGGLFPLKKPVGDQRDIQIWDQMNLWLYENYGNEF